MSKCYIDTEQLEKAANDIKNYANKLDQLLTSYVERMGKVPYETKEWQGNSAENFVQIIKNDYKKEYIPLITTIKKYANELDTAANECKKIVTENNL
jgi:uncharacterized protein YukE